MSGCGKANQIFAGAEHSAPASVPFFRTVLGQIAAANARIGVARSAWFPTLTLSAQGGYQSNEFANLLSAPNLFWAIGPSLVGTLFDGGLRKAQIDSATAATDEAAGKYRAQVLAAFEQVENNLSIIDGLGSALDDQRAAAEAAQYTENLSMARYKQGYPSGQVIYSPPQSQDMVCT